MIGPVSRVLAELSKVMDPEQRELAARRLRSMEGDRIDRNFFRVVAEGLEQTVEDDE